MMMKKPSLTAVACAAMLMGLTACSGSYRNQIQGSYGSYHTKGNDALRAKDYERAADHYAFAAKSGHPRALISYGRLFARGNGVDQDPARAVALFSEARDKASPFKSKAALELAQLYLKGGDGPSGEVAKDEVRARKLFLEALKGGEARAASNLGKIYDRGLGVDPDPAEAIEFYRQASANDGNSARRLATLLAKTGGPEDEIASSAGRAIEVFEVRGEAGDGRALIQLADIFSKGQIVEADQARAASYLERLPEDNDPAMNMNLARLYGQIGDQGERKRRLRLAADAGEAKAQTTLAKLFLTPDTADTNGAVGRYYAERAIGQKSESAMFYLGLALLRGRVLEQEPVAGELLLRRASQEGHVGASAALGAAILNGDVRGREPDEGLKLLEAAADKGAVSAMSALGFAYQKGRGVLADEVLALEWLRKAADAGSRKAQAFLDRRQEEGA